MSKIKVQILVKQSEEVRKRAQEVKEKWTRSDNDDNTTEH